MLDDRIDRKLNGAGVIDVLSDLFILRGMPAYIRSDNGPEFLAKSPRSVPALTTSLPEALGRTAMWELQCQASR